MQTRMLPVVPAARISAPATIALLTWLGLMGASAQALACAGPSGVDSVVGARESSQDSLSSTAERPNPSYVAPAASNAKPKRPRSLTRKVLVFTAEAALAEGLIAFNADIASGSPLGYSIIFILLTPLAAGGGPQMSKTDKIVTVAAVGSIPIYNLIMSTGEHSEETIFNGNMIVWNTLLIGSWVSRKTVFKKDKAPRGGGSGGKGTWSTELGTVGNGPGLRVAYRF